MAESIALERTLVAPRIVAIRCETGIDSGFGHLTRMLTLAEALQNRDGAIVKFLCDRNPIVERVLEAERFHYAVKDPSASEEEFVEQATRPADIVIVDNKHDYAADFVRALRRSRTIVFVDHCSAGVFAANLTIFPCAAVSADVIEDRRWGDGRAGLLHGARYVLLGRRVLDMAERRCSTRNSGPIVLTTGARDPERVLLTVLPWLARFRTDRRVVALCGDAFANRAVLERLTPQLPAHVRVVPFSQTQLAEAGVAVCTFGVTTYELMFLGIPALVIGHCRDNAETSRILAERCRATIDLGFIGDLTEEKFLPALSYLIDDEGRRLEMSRLGAAEIDGRGAERAAQAILAL
jgi:spore coat polysaccharide biosynthesis predicted glycosyltransferase SpsG